MTVETKDELKNAILEMLFNNTDNYYVSKCFSSQGSSGSITVAQRIS